MKKQYGMGMPEKAGKVLCAKCHTYYELRKGKQVCPFCSHPKPDPEKSETVKGGKPTQVDKDLYNYMQNATLEQKTKIIEFIKEEL